MLRTIPSGAYGRLGAVISALIVVFCIIGLTMHKDFYAGIRRRGFFCFYTNLSNLLVLLYFALLAPLLYQGHAFRPMIPHAEFMIMMCIMLTFFVFHSMIFPAVWLAARKAARTREFYIALVDNGIVHYLVPWLVFAYWLLCSPGKNMLAADDALMWTLIPALYLIFILLRAGMLGEKGVIADAGSPYPYPFLDIGALGCMRVARVCLWLYGICIAAGIIIIACVRLLTAIFDTGHALFLI